MKLHDLPLSVRISAGAMLLVGLGALALLCFEEAHLREVYLNQQRAQLEESFRVSESRLTGVIATLGRDARFLAATPPPAGIMRAAGNQGYDARDGNTRAQWKERMRQIFAPFLSARPEYCKVIYLGREGQGREFARIVSQSGLVEKNQAGEPEFAADYLAAVMKLRPGQVYFSEINLQREGEGQAPGPAIQASAPVFAENGRLFGLVMICLDLRSLLESTALNFNLPPGFSAFICDRHGHYLLRPGVEAGSGASLHDDLPVLAAGLDPRSPRFMPLREVAGKAGPQYLSYGRINYQAGNQERFLLLGFQATGGVRQGIAAIPRKHIAAGFMALFLICALLLFLLRRIFFPLQQLALAADAVTAGRHDFSLPPGGSGEIGRLAGALGLMLTELSRREQEIIKANEELEQQVAQRTQELTVANDNLAWEIAEREGQLREAEALHQRQQTLMHTAMDGIHIMDMEGNLLEANDAFWRMLGYSGKEAVGLKVSDWDVRWTPDELRAGFKNLLGGSALIESKNRRKDGVIIDVEIACTGVEIAGQGYVYAASRDITERQRNALALRHMQEMLNVAQRLGKLGSWELDLESGILLWSDEAYRIFELGPALFAPSYENFLALVHPDDREKVQAAYDRSLQDRQPYNIVHRLLFADGRCKWLREQCDTTFDSEGRPLRSVGMVQDISAQKEAEEALRVAAATFETHEAVMITDAAGGIIRVNRGFTGITGYAPEEVLGKDSRFMSTGRHDNKFFAGVLRKLARSGSWEGEIWGRRKNGEVFPQWMTITALRDEQQGTTGYVAVFSDITERKKSEEAIYNLAFYDPLTGLPNRRLLADRLHTAFHVSARHGGHGAVMFVDLDRFKLLNDTMGHDYGDLMLEEVARRLTASVRETDTVSRLGGDEFIVLAEDLGVARSEAARQAGLVAEKIREALNRPYSLNGYEYSISPSIGVCLFKGNEEEVEELIQHADLAMYQAKNSGRNKVCFCESEPPA